MALQKSKKVDNEVEMAVKKTTQVNPLTLKTHHQRRKNKATPRIRPKHLSSKG